MTTLETTRTSFATTQTPASKYFPTHDLETAPVESRPFLAESERRFGFIPLASARHATAPAVLEGFTHLLDVFERTSLSPLEREAVALSLAGKLDCRLCRDLHRRFAQKHGASHELIEGLIARRDVPDARLRALVELTERVVNSHGVVSDAELESFLAAGFTARQALEVVVGVATYTLSILANHLTRSETLR